MNNIIGMYNVCKHVESFDSMVDVLHLEYGMPRRAAYPVEMGLFSQCEMLASDWVRHQYAKMLRPRGTVPDMELRGNIECTACMFYAILEAGAVKPLYLITREASDFIQSTAFTQRLEPRFFKENFARPLVLYSGEPKTMFNDVLCIEIFYNQDGDCIECILSCADAHLPSHEYLRTFSIEDITGVFTRQKIGCDEIGDSALYLIRHGIVDSVAELDAKFFDAMLYAFKFVLLRQCTKQTIVVEAQYRNKSNENKRKQIFGTLKHQRVSLSSRYQTIYNTTRNAETLVLDKEGKELRAIKVQGFLRRQHYGPENSLVKVIYIEAHESHAWMQTGLRLIRVVR